MSDITNFPNGISSAGQVIKAGTLVTVAPFSTGTVNTGLGTVQFAVSAVQTAGTGASHSSAGTVTGGGTVISNVYGTAAAAATVAATLHWIAAGTV